MSGISGMTLLAFLVPILGVAGFVSGLAGFAFSGIGAVILWLLPPFQAVPLLLSLSIANQLLAMSSLWAHMNFMPKATGEEGALPYIIGGILGAPLGVELLRQLPPHVMAGLFGWTLTVFALMLLSRPVLPRITIAGWSPALISGWLGGIVGGFSAFPGSVPVAYLTLRHTNKEATRGAIQPFIITMQILSLCILAAHHPEIFDRGFAIRFLACLPAVLAGSLIGVRTFHALHDYDFRRVILMALTVSGGALVVKSLLG